MNLAVIKSAAQLDAAVQAFRAKAARLNIRPKCQYSVTFAPIKSFEELTGQVHAMGITILSNSAAGLCWPALPRRIPALRIFAWGVHVARRDDHLCCHAGGESHSADTLAEGRDGAPRPPPSCG